jgi:hypothetical protein
MIKTAIGVSDDIDVPDALASVIDACKEQLAGDIPQAGILFTSLMDASHKDMLTEINRAFPSIDLIGCTTDGEIVPTHGFLEDSIALLLFSSPDMQIGASIATDLSSNAALSLPKAIRECQNKLTGEPVFGLILPDGLTTIGIDLGTILQSALGKSFPFFGGTAGDSFRLKQTYQFYNNEVYTDAAPIFLFAGDITLESKICSGVKPIGSYYTIDEARANIVTRINGQRAADVYEELLGDYIRERQALQFPLAVYEEGLSGFYLRDPMHIDSETGEITFIGTFPERCRAKFVAIDREKILQSAEEASDYLLADTPDTAPELIMIFSCTSRKHTLGTRAREEFRRLLATDSQIPFFGFYCYGELGPNSVGKPTRFHNDTFVAIAIRSGSR